MQTWKSRALETVARYRRDVRFRMTCTLTGSFVMNVLYAAMQLFLGLHADTNWFYCLSAYYALLALLRWMLLSNVRKGHIGGDLLYEYKRYRFCGWVLLVINQALVSIVVLIVRWNRGYSYHEITTIALATYTFYSLTMAIINIVRFRKFNSPILSAGKVLSLTCACVSMLSLETAMISAFGEGDNALFRTVMTSLTGGAVCLLVLAMAMYMIVHATKEMKKIKQEEQYE